MIDYIASLLGYKIVPSEYIQVTLIPPVVLMLQLIEMTAGSANNIVQVFQSLQLPIDPISFLKKYRNECTFKINLIIKKTLIS